MSLNDSSYAAEHTCVCTYPRMCVFSQEIFWCCILWNEMRKICLTLLSVHPALFALSGSSMEHINRHVSPFSYFMFFFFFASAYLSNNPWPSRPLLSWMSWGTGGGCLPGLAVIDGYGGTERLSLYRCRVYCFFHLRVIESLPQ